MDQVGEVLGRPWLTTIVDTYSRCIIGLHLGMEAPSAVVVCLALRHAILPKQYSSAYELTQLWGTDQGETRKNGRNRLGASFSRVGFTD